MNQHHKEAKVTAREKLLKSRIDCDLERIKCLKCGTVFSSIKTLYFHMLTIHAAERVYYPCPVCDGTFGQLWTVRRHLIKVHKKSKEELAHLKTAIKSTKISRKKKLGDEEWFITCKYCMRDFSTPANLRRHIARHLGVTRYHCELCDYKTFDRSECYSHVKRKHSQARIRPVGHRGISWRTCTENAL